MGRIFGSVPSLQPTSPVVRPGTSTTERILGSIGSAFSRRVGTGFGGWVDWLPFVNIEEMDVTHRLRNLGINEDGLFVTVGTPSGVPVLTEQVARAADLEPAFANMQSFIDNPLAYEKPERLEGGQTRINGKRFNWAPGYKRYHRAVADTKGFRILSTRPFHPIFNQEGRRTLAEWARTWIALGSSTFTRANFSFSAREARRQLFGGGELAGAG